MADNGAPRSAWWLQENFAPVAEIEALDLNVDGALPPELTGVYMRNGPNPTSRPAPHWFLGDGMLHGVRLQKGKALWYRNRMVRTKMLAQAGNVDADDRTASLANTNVVRHAGKILALEELHFPYEVSNELTTRGAVDFKGRLKRGFTAHPKLCPVTGEMLAFGYDYRPPFLTYYRIDAKGELAQETEIPVTGPTMVHDFGVTATRVIFMDLPIVFDAELAQRGDMPYHWSNEYPARLGVMPRNGTAKDLRWYDIPPCYVFHPMNAYDDGERIVFDVSRHGDMWGDGGSDGAQLTRWVIDPASGRVSQTQLDDVPMEFPRVPDARAGLPYRYGYAVGMVGSRSSPFSTTSVLHKYDLRSGTVSRWDFGPGRQCAEFVHGAAPGGEEDAGWLMGFVHDRTTQTTSFAVLGASNVAKGPVATIALPQRVPYGFHGGWFAD